MVAVAVEAVAAEAVAAVAVAIPAVAVAVAAEAVASFDTVEAVAGCLVDSHPCAPDTNTVPISHSN